MLDKYDGLPLGYDARTRPWYVGATKKISEDRYTFITDPYADAASSKSGTIIISSSMPIYNKGKLIGVLAADLDISGLIQLLKNQGSATGVRPVLYVKTDGTIIYHPSFDLSVKKEALKDLFAELKIPIDDTTLSNLYADKQTSFLHSVHIPTEFLFHFFVFKNGRDYFLQACKCCFAFYYIVERSMVHTVDSNVNFVLRR